MTTRFERLDDLFARASELPRSERRPFLARACAGDRALEAQVLALLSTHERAGEELEGIVARAVRPGAATAVEARETERLWVGQTCGAWRLVERIGSGGMGTVYLAERADEQFRQRAALKLMRGAGFDEHGLEAFHRERQVLARLEHPGIARLIDGGSIDGQPYLVMEYVEGEPIDRWCDARRLPVRQRLRLFQAVCAALHYAHAHLVVHLDVKPRNILVTAAGETKVLDFGIARTLRGESLATVVTQQAMTPEYASPEQLLGRPLTVASDVYSLGVLLFQLLTGRKPFEGQTQALPVLARRVCEEQPPLPSSVVAPRGSAQEREQAGERARRRATSPERLRRRLAGDLDNVVLMALRKEAERRYASAEQLAADVQRHLEGQPLLAHRDTLAYRAAKFTRRHRVGMAATLLVIAALGVALVVQRSALARERDMTSEIQAQLTALFETIDWSREAALLAAGLDAIPPLLLQRNPRLARLTEILEKGEALATRATYRDPLLQIAHLEQIAEGYVQLAQGSGARRVRERVLGMLRALPDREPLHEARLLQSLGRVEQALAIRERLLVPPHADIAESMHHLARQRREQGDLDAAEDLFARARAMIQAAGEGDTARFVGWLQSEAGFRQRTRRIEDGLAMAEEAVRLARGLDDPSLEASALGTRGWMRQDAGHFEQGLADLLEAEAIDPTSSIDGHPLQALRKHALALVYKDMGRFAEAHAALQAAIANTELNYGPDSLTLSDEVYSMARLLADEGRWGESEPWARRALDMIQRRFREPSGEHGDALTTLGRILVRLGRHEEALGLLEQALANRRRFLDPGFWELSKTESILGEALAHLGRCEEAREQLEESVPRIAASRGEHHYRTAQAWRRLVVWSELCGTPEQAAAYRARITPQARMSPIVQATVP